MGKILWLKACALCVATSNAIELLSNAIELLAFDL